VNGGGWWLMQTAKRVYYYCVALTIDQCTHQWCLEEEQQPSRPKRLTMGSILRCRNELASFKISITSDTCNNPKARAMGAHSMFSSEALFFQELGSLETRVKELYIVLPLQVQCYLTKNIIVSS
jgi:hypothetical protein